MPREGLRWGPFAFAGIIGVLIGLVTFFWPGLTALALVSLVAFWSVVTGVAQIVAAIRLRKVIEHEWLLALSGALSVAFGVLIFLWPVAGVVALAIWIGAFALVYGALLIGVGFRLRRWRKSHGDVGGGAPVPRHA